MTLQAHAHGRLRVGGRWAAGWAGPGDILSTERPDPAFLSTLKHRRDGQGVKCADGFQGQEACCTEAIDRVAHFGASFRPASLLTENGIGSDPGRLLMKDDALYPQTTEDAG